MFRFSRILWQQNKEIIYDNIKKAGTGITGVPVISNSRQVLSRVYTATIEKAETLPSDLALKGHIISLCRHRLNVVLEEEDVEQLERRLNCGQIEELVAQAEWDYKLVNKMLEDKEWEKIKSPNPTAIPIGFINHENFEGVDAENRAGYYSMVSDLADEDAQLFSFEDEDEAANIKDAYERMLYHIYQKPRNLFNAKEEGAEKETK